MVTSSIKALQLDFKDYGLTKDIILLTIRLRYLWTILSFSTL